MVVAFLQLGECFCRGGDEPVFVSLVVGAYMLVRFAWCSVYAFV